MKADIRTSTSSLSVAYNPGFQYFPHTRRLTIATQGVQFGPYFIVNDWICSLIGNGTFAPIIPNPSPQATVQGDIVGSGRYLTLAEPSPLEEIADRLMKGFATTYGEICTN